MNARLPLAGLVAVVVWAMAAAAGATPVTLYGDAANGFGFAPADVANANLQFLPDQAGFLTSPGTNITVVTPTMITGNNVPGATPTNPSTGSSTWTITNKDRDYQNLWLVVVGHAVTKDPYGPNGNGHYASANVGLEIDDADPNWRFVRPVGMNLTYLAYRVGALNKGASTALDIEYRVSQALFEAMPNEFVFPKYQVAFLAAVPEPGLWTLGTVAIVALSVRRRWWASR